MGAKQKDLGESPMLFMDWPSITVEENEIILKSSITQVRISDTRAHKKSSMKRK